MRSNRGMAEKVLYDLFKFEDDAADSSDPGSADTHDVEDWENYLQFVATRISRSAAEGRNDFEKQLAASETMKSIVSLRKDQLGTRLSPAAAKHGTNSLIALGAWAIPLIFTLGPWGTLVVALVALGLSAFLPDELEEAVRQRDWKRVRKLSEKYAKGGGADALQGLFGIVTNVSASVPIAIERLLGVPRRGGPTEAQGWKHPKATKKNLDIRKTDAFAVEHAIYEECWTTLGHAFTALRPSIPDPDLRTTAVIGAYWGAVDVSLRFCDITTQPSGGPQKEKKAFRALAWEFLPVSEDEDQISLVSWYRGRFCDNDAWGFKGALKAWPPTSPYTGPKTLNLV